MAQHVADPAEAEPEAVVQPRTEGLRVRPDLHPRRAERVGDLTGMTSLQPAGAPDTVADRHGETGSDHLRVGHLHLPLLLVTVVAHLAAAIGAGLRQLVFRSFGPVGYWLLTLLKASRLTVAAGCGPARRSSSMASSRSSSAAWAATCLIWSRSCLARRSLLIHWLYSSA